MKRTCPQCGHQSQDDVPRFCSACGIRIDGSGIPADTVSEPHNPDQKNPQIAVFCSSFIPGLGQVYNGETLKGFVMLFGSLFGALLLLIPGLVIWVYSMYDAHITAGKMNEGAVGFRPMVMSHMVLFIAVAVIIAVAGVMIVSILIISWMVSLLGSSGNSDTYEMMQFYGRFF